MPDRYSRHHSSSRSRSPGGHHIDRRRRLDKRHGPYDSDYKNTTYASQTSPSQPRRKHRHHRRPSHSPSRTPPRERPHRRRPSRSLSTSKSPSRSEQSDVDEETLLQRSMGFTSFNTTKNTAHTETDVSAINRRTKRKYRQYMNRRGGFNRPLSPTH